MPNFVADPYLYNNAEGAGVSAASSTGNCSYTADASPYGSIIPPTGSDVQMMSPSEWGELNDGNPADNANKSDNFPLFYSESGARMGQLYNSSTLSYLFAESYGVWDWNSAEGTYVMNPTSTLNWSSPSNLCDKNIRTVDNPNCAVRPELNIYDVATERYKNSIKLNGGDNAQILGRGFVNLTFNSKVDSEQAPLTMYEIDWGDDEKLIVSGADMKEMPNESNPHSAFHAYDYWDLYGKYQDDSKRNDMPTLFCGTKNNVDYCSVKPKVKIKDNWGWCSEGRTGVACPVPNGASCVDGNGNVGASNPYCRDYVASGYRVLSRVCPSSYRYCSDGYYESVGEVLVYNYAAR